MAWPVEPNLGTFFILLLYGTPPLVSAWLMSIMLRNATGVELVEDGFQDIEKEFEA